MEKEIIKEEKKTAKIIQKYETKDLLQKNKINKALTRFKQKKK